MSSSLLIPTAQVFCIDDLRNQSWWIVGVDLKLTIPLHFEGDLVHVALPFPPGNLGELIQCLNTPLCSTCSWVFKVVMSGRIRTSTIFFSFVFKWIIKMILFGFVVRRSGSQLYIWELLIRFPLRELARQNLKLVQKGNHDHELHADSCFLLQADFTIPIERAVGLLFDPSVADKMDRFWSILSQEEYVLIMENM